MIVVATKLDATTDRTRLERLRAHCAERNLDFYAISSATGEGIRELVRGMAETLERLAPAEALTEPDGDIHGDANSNPPHPSGTGTGRASGAGKS
jgi:50S ribosomal subunit-associated GTPase HflX